MFLDRHVGPPCESIDQHLAPPHTRRHGRAAAPVPSPPLSARFLDGWRHPAAVGVARASGPLISILPPVRGRPGRLRGWRHPAAASAEPASSRLMASCGLSAAVLAAGRLPQLGACATIVPMKPNEALPILAKIFVSAAAWRTRKRMPHYCPDDETDDEAHGTRFGRRCLSARRPRNCTAGISSKYGPRPFGAEPTRSDSAVPFRGASGGILRSSLDARSLCD